MKFVDFQNIDAGTRSAILISVAAAFFAWDIGFELGVYGQIFPEKVFFAWSITTALLIMFVWIPKEELPVPPSLWVATAIPTLWLIVVLVNRAAPDEWLLRHVVTVLGFAAVLLCFPYVIYVSLSLLYPDVLKTKRSASKAGIIFVVIFMLLAGFFIGANHHWFLTCEDFEISGSHVPSDCVPHR